MEGTYRKRYYSRNRTYGRSKKNTKKENFVFSVTRQTLICIIIFLIVLGLKSVNISMTKALGDQIRGLLAYTTDIGSAYQSAAAYAQKLNTMLKSNSIPTVNTIKPQETQVKEQDLPTQEQTAPIKDPAVPTQAQDPAKSPDSKIGESTQQTSQSTSEVQGAKTTQGAVALKPANPINQPIVAPIQGVVTSKYGMRMHPIDQKEKFHYGIDIDGKKGENIAASMDGEVVETGVNETYGKFIRLQHKDGFYTFYGHCSDVIVKKGQKVKMKEVIGNVGDTGVALGVHLHFEIWKDNKALDPLQYIQLSIDSTT